MTRGFPRHMFVRTTGALCSVCREPQYRTIGGDCCKNGHGGADPLPDSGPVIDPNVVHILTAKAADESVNRNLFKKVVALTLRLHATAVILGPKSPEAERVRLERAGLGGDRLTRTQQDEILELDAWLEGFATRNSLL